MKDQLLRKRYRQTFVKQRYIIIHQIIPLYTNSGGVRFGIDWRNHIHRPSIQLIIQQAREIVYYSPNSNDYDIWLAILVAYKKVNQKILNKQLKLQYMSITLFLTISGLIVIDTIGYIIRCHTDKNKSFPSFKARRYPFMRLFYTNNPSLKDK